MAPTKKELPQIPVSREQVRAKREAVIQTVLTLLNLPAVDTWGQRDQQVAGTLGLAKDYVKRVRLGFRNFSQQKLVQLQEALAAHSEFLSVDDLGQSVWGPVSQTKGS